MQGAILGPKAEINFPPPRLSGVSPSAKEGPLRPVQPTLKPRLRPKHTLATGRLLTQRPCVWAGFPFEILHWTPPTRRCDPWPRTAAQPGLSYPSTSSTTAPAPRRTSCAQVAPRGGDGRGSQSGRLMSVAEGGRERRRHGEPGGDSLAEVIGQWKTRFRTRHRAGRGTRRGGGRSSRLQPNRGAVSQNSDARGSGRRRPRRSGLSARG